LPAIQFGFSIPLAAPYAAPNFKTLDYKSIKQAVLTCEEFGYDALWAADHLGYHGIGSSIFECWTLLSALAAVTRRVRLGPLVLCNGYRHPSMIAKMAATLDVVSNGRLDFGIGAGNNKVEHVAYGLPWFDKPSTRIQRMVEGIEVVKRMWTEAKPSFKGKHYEIQEAICEPKPIQKPYPPIWIGGAGEKLTLRATAKYAQGWNHWGGVSVEIFRRKLEALEKHCLDLGRGFNTIEKSLETRVIISEDPLEIRVLAARFAPDASLEELKRSQIIGTPDEVVRRLEEYVSVGAGYFMLWFLDFPSLKGMRLFAERVMPCFK